MFLSGDKILRIHPKSQGAGRPNHLLKFHNLEEIIKKNIRVKVATSGEFLISNICQRRVHVLANLVRRTRTKHDNL